MNKKLFIFEMANNHMGDVDHGKRIIRQFATVKDKYTNKYLTHQPKVEYGIKFQFREMGSFIHPDYQDRTDIKYVKRFQETALTDEEFLELKNLAEELGFIPICTGFDEPSIGRIEKMGFPLIKIGSCSFNDWPLLNRIAEVNLPIIASTATATLEEIDNVVSFFLNRKKELTLMHCVAEYPTHYDNMQLNQIKLFKERYPGVRIGFSTHEAPHLSGILPMAIAMGAEVFEKHVGVETEEYSLNAYSSTPDEIDRWLLSAFDSFDICGKVEGRHEFTDKEISDIRTFKRGVFANRDIQTGDIVTREDVFYAFPCKEGQVLANEMSKYIKYTATSDISKNESISTCKNVESKNLRKDILRIRDKVRTLVLDSGVVVPHNAPLEISHHYGIENFYKTGLSMVTVVNEGYCKKLLISLPNQVHPTQWHEKKTETFVVLYGEAILYLDDEVMNLIPGDVATVRPLVKHRFMAGNKGLVLEEISTTHYVDDSYYEDSDITENKNRKTFVSHWMN